VCVFLKVWSPNLIFTNTRAKLAFK